MASTSPVHSLKPSSVHAKATAKDTMQQRSTSRQATRRTSPNTIVYLHRTGLKCCPTPAMTTPMLTASPPAHGGILKLNGVLDEEITPSHRSKSLETESPQLKLDVPQEENDTFPKNLNPTLPSGSYPPSNQTETTT